jgi:hypothetical protein
MEYKTVGNLKIPQNLSPEKQVIVDEIARNYAKRDKEISKEHNKNMAKLYGGAALEIGSAAIPMGAGARLAGSTIKAIAPYVGRKIAQEIGTGLVGGGLSGSVFGAGRGLMENKNPVETAAYDALVGALSGAGTGAVVGKIGKEFAKKNIKNFKDSNNYYKNFEQGVNTNNRDIGKIELSSDGFKETNKQKPEFLDKVIELSKNLRKAKLIGKELPKNEHKYNIDYFNRLQGDDVDYLVAHNADTDRNFFHKVIDSQLTGPKPEAKSLSNNIITENEQNLNLLKKYYEDYIQGLKNESEGMAELRALRQGFNPSKNRLTLFDSEYNPDIEKLARDYFGTTDNRREAGYILNDGSYLDFSGKKFGGPRGQRTMDHREVVDAFLDNPANVNNLEIGFDEFIDNGAVRYMPETNSFFMSRQPSEEQLKRIKDLLDYERGKSSIELVPNVQDWGLDNNFRRDYELWSDPKKIIDDIRTYFKGGKPSDLKNYM